MILRDAFFVTSKTRIYREVFGEELFEEPHLTFNFSKVKPQEKEQIKSLIANFESSREHIPYLRELEEHPALGPVFRDLKDAEKDEVNHVIKEYIEEKIASLKTKGGQLFRRFFENDNKKFWEFRDLNEREEQTESEEFQELGKYVEDEMFKLEGILTQAMMGRESGLWKTVEAFYNIVYNFFPLFSSIE